MKKKNVINLIKYHTEGKENEFRNEAYEIAQTFLRNGDEELAHYIMSILNKINIFMPQSVKGTSNFFKINSECSDTFMLPHSIETDIFGIINAIRHGADINKFLFVGQPGTGKTEACKQISRILKRELYFVQFDEIVDSKLGQTSKNIIKLFDDINALKNPNGVIILFDELDALALDRINSNDLREMGRVTSTLLRMLDSLDQRIVLIATTNLHDKFDKALLRRFDYIVNFNDYTKDELVEVAKSILNNELNKYKSLSKDTRLSTKIFNLYKDIPYPGDLKNIIRSAVAFSDLTKPYGYLSTLYEKIIGKKLPTDLKALSEQGFSVRDIEKLTGISKSSVSRGILNE